MHTEADHKALLRSKGPFKIDCNTIIFSDTELALLKRYGHWFEALSNGQLTPITEQQTRFVQVAQGELPPFSLEEGAWFKYLGRKRIEKEKGAVLYQTPRLDEDPFYSREGAKHLRKQQFKTIRQTHRE
ncbi:MAG: DUF413 domain-containing protein [Salibacteraceae bacterium]